MARLRRFGGSNDAQSDRNQFNNVYFGGKNQVRDSRNDFNNVSFGGSNEIRSGRNDFNNVFFRGNMNSQNFEGGQSYFRGGSPDTFSHTNDRDIIYNASGCGKLNAVGGVTTLGVECPDGCAPCLIGGQSCCEGQFGNGGLCQGAAKQVQGGTKPSAKQTQGNNPCPFPCYPCPNGRGCCGVTDYGSCSDHSPRKGRKKPKSLSASGVRQVIGGCPSGCSPCYNGVGCCQDGAPETPCASGARKVGADFVNCPKGKCWNGVKCVPCAERQVRGKKAAATKGGRDLSNGGFRLR